MGWVMALHYLEGLWWICVTLRGSVMAQCYLEGLSDDSVLPWGAQWWLCVADKIWPQYSRLSQKSGHPKHGRWGTHDQGFLYMINQGTLYIKDQETLGMIGPLQFFGSVYPISLVDQGSQPETCEFVLPTLEGFEFVLPIPLFWDPCLPPGPRSYDMRVNQ